MQLRSLVRSGGADDTVEGGQAAPSETSQVFGTSSVGDARSQLRRTERQERMMKEMAEAARQRDQLSAALEKIQAQAEGARREAETFGVERAMMIALLEQASVGRSMLSQKAEEGAEGRAGMGLRVEEEEAERHGMEARMKELEEERRGLTAAVDEAREERQRQEHRVEALEEKMHSRAEEAERSERAAVASLEEAEERLQVRFQAHDAHLAWCIAANHYVASTVVAEVDIYSLMDSSMDLE